MTERLNIEGRSQLEKEFETLDVLMKYYMKDLKRGGKITQEQGELVREYVRAEFSYSDEKRKLGDKSDIEIVDKLIVKHHELEERWQNTGGLNRGTLMSRADSLHRMTTGRFKIPWKEARAELKEKGLR
ncbi:MAG TPA: hypothetical protein VF185_01120 [Patescibacteria group bacterium]